MWKVLLNIRNRLSGIAFKTTVKLTITKFAMMKKHEDNLNVIKLHYEQFFKMYCVLYCVMHCILLGLQ